MIYSISKTSFFLCLPILWQSQINTTSVESMQFWSPISPLNTIMLARTHQFCASSDHINVKPSLWIAVKNALTIDVLTIMIVSNAPQGSVVANTELRITGYANFLIAKAWSQVVSKAAIGRCFLLQGYRSSVKLNWRRQLFYTSLSSSSED